MKKKLIGVLLTVSCAFMFAQVTISGEFTGFYSIGIANESQAITDTPPPVASIYNTTDAKKNALYANSYLTLSAQPTAYIEAVLRLRAYHQLGSPYIRFSLADSSSPSIIDVSLDKFYGKFDIATAINQLSPVAAKVVFGKYDAEPANYGTVTKYGVESVLKMLKVGKTLNVGVDVSMYLPITGRISLNALTNAKFNEAISKLYNTDGALEQHGTVIPGAYAPQFYAALRLSDMYLPFGTISAEAIYAMNAADVYSGDNYGLGVRYEIPVIQEILTIPVGLSFAYYDKNIDVLANAATIKAKEVEPRGTADFRTTIRGGLGIGARYTPDNTLDISLNLGSTVSQIQHYYYKPLLVVNGAIDFYARYKQYFFGAGFIAGTLKDIKWQYKDGGETPPNDITEKTFSVAQNMGYEVYIGMDLMRSSKLIFGFNNNKGMSMAYGLESMSKEGEMKIKQKNTARADNFFETSAFFIKAVLSF